MHDKVTKGNLEHANIAEWSNSLQKVKDHYPNVKTIVPSHGKIGGADLSRLHNRTF